MSDIPTEDVVLKSSGDWVQENQVFVMDPDGWDRVNLETSWAELISEDEFNSRLMQSTIYVISPDPAPVMSTDPDEEGPTIIYPDAGDNVTPTPDPDPVEEPTDDPTDT